MIEHLYTVHEAAKVLRVCPDTVRKIAPDVPGFRIGKRIVFRESDLQAFIERQSQRASKVVEFMPRRAG